MDVRFVDVVLDAKHGAVEERLDTTELTSEDEDRGDELDGEMVLSKEDYHLLQAFHRLVPLPALSSKILRVVCDDDLQVVEEEERSCGDVTCRSALDPTSETETDPMLTRKLATVPIMIGSMAKYSPLTRRLSTKMESKNGLIKPHREINLAVHTPRIKMATIDTFNGDDRIG